MFSINQLFSNVTVNSDACNQSTNSYDIHFNEVNKYKSKYNTSSDFQFICENWGGGVGGGR